LIEKPLYTLITNLHLEGDLVLHSDLLNLTGDDQAASLYFLEKQFQEEKLENYHSCDFDSQAALIAACSIFNIAHLIYYRELSIDNIVPLLIPILELPTTASTIISTDLILRFLPQITNILKAMSPDDEILPLLEDVLKKWHYSAINYNFENVNLNFDEIKGDNFLFDLYKKRIIQFKNIKLGSMPLFYGEIIIEFGNYRELFWKELTLENE
jgi:hypothetical protein